MTNTGRRPRHPILCRAEMSIFSLLIAAVSLAGCGVMDAELPLHEALAPISAVCSERMTEALCGAHDESTAVPAQHKGETSVLIGKEPYSRLRSVRSRPLAETPFGIEGTAGRLVIPSAGINVALNLPGEDAQATADAEDSACWMEYPGDLNGVIGDHVNQDFSVLFGVRPGDVCTIYKNGKEHHYVCVSTDYGSNIETDVLGADGESLFMRGEDRLCMYTCANGWRHIFVTEWQITDDRPLHQRSAPLPPQIYWSENAAG